MEYQDNRPVRRQTRFQKLLSTLLSFDEDQLAVLIQLARQVHKSKVLLKDAANKAEQLMDSLKSGKKLEQIEMFKPKSEPVQGEGVREES